MHAITDAELAEDVGDSRPVGGSLLAGVVASAVGIVGNAPILLGYVLPIVWVLATGVDLWRGGEGRTGAAIEAAA